jgi:hypothetical protein
MGFMIFIRCGCGEANRSFPEHIPKAASDAAHARLRIATGKKL